MAENHAEAFKAIEGVEVVAACDVSAVRVDAFSENHDIHNRFTRLEDALAWNRFDAVANVTPDAVHHPTTLALVGAGKHVFCEKPLAESYEKAPKWRMRPSRRAWSIWSTSPIAMSRPCRRRARW